MDDDGSMCQIQGMDDHGCHDILSCHVYRFTAFIC